MGCGLEISSCHFLNGQRTRMDFLIPEYTFCWCTYNPGTGNSGQGLGGKLKKLPSAFWESNVKCEAFKTKKDPLLLKVRRKLPLMRPAARIPEESGEMILCFYLALLALESGWKPQRLTSPVSHSAVNWLLRGISSGVSVGPTWTSSAQSLRCYKEEGKTQPPKCRSQSQARDHGGRGRVVVIIIGHFLYARLSSKCMTT